MTIHLGAQPVLPAGTIPQPTFDPLTVPEPYRDRMISLIPDARLADRYVHRGIEGLQDFEAFDVAASLGHNLCLVGPTGSAKTTALRAYAAARRLPFALIECSAAMDPAAVMGRTVATEGTTRFEPADPFLVVKFGGLVDIDEVNQLHPRLAAAYYALLAVTRRTYVAEAGETLWAGHGGTGGPQKVIFATTHNPGYRGTVVLSEALKNRLPCPTPWGYDPEVEKILVMSAHLRELAAQIRADRDIRSECSTNMLQEFERHVMAGGPAFGMRLARLWFVSRFEDDERGPIDRCVEPNLAKIAADLGVSW